MGVRAAARASTARPSARRPAAAATLATTTHAARFGLPSRKTPSHPLCHDGPASPVTPEVAGSSPVAPAPSTKALHSGPSLRPGWALLTAHGLARDYATEPVLALVAESMQRLPRSGVVFLGRPPDSQDPTTQTSLVERVDDVAQGRLVGARHRRDPRRRHARQGRQQDDRRWALGPVRGLLGDRLPARSPRATARRPTPPRTHRHPHVAMPPGWARRVSGQTLMAGPLGDVRQLAQAGGRRRPRRACAGAPGRGSSWLGRDGALRTVQPGALPCAFAPRVRAGGLDEACAARWAARAGRGGPSSSRR